MPRLKVPFAFGSLRRHLAVKALPALAWAALTGSPCDLRAGETWVSPGPLPAGTGYFTSIHFLDPVTGIAAGPAGSLHKTTDGGRTWQTRRGGDGRELRKVGFLRGGSLGHAVGDKGVLLRSEDGGDRWVPADSFTGETLIDVHFVDSLNGGALSQLAEYFRTADGGRTWSRHRLGPSKVQVLYFFDSQLAFIGGAGYSELAMKNLFRSLDGGVTWQVLDSLTPVLGSMHFLSRSKGWGTGWRMVPLPDSGYRHESAVYATIDGGLTWTPMLQADSCSFTSVHFLDSATGFAAGNAWPGTGRIWKTTDGGRSWREQAVVTFTGSFKLAFPDARTGYALGRDYTDMAAGYPGQLLALRDAAIGILPVGRPAGGVGVAGRTRLDRGLVMFAPVPGGVATGFRVDGLGRIFRLSE